MIASTLYIESSCFARLQVGSTFSDLRLQTGCLLPLGCGRQVFLSSANSRDVRDFRGIDSVLCPFPEISTALIHPEYVLCVHINIYIYMYIYTYIQLYTDIYIYIHIYTFILSTGAIKASSMVLFI